MSLHLRETGARDGAETPGFRQFAGRSWRGGGAGGCAGRGSRGAVGLALEKLIWPELRHMVSQLQGQ
jgi:hypothetical protein